MTRCNFTALAASRLCTSSAAAGHARQGSRACASARAHYSSRYAHGVAIVGHRHDAAKRRFGCPRAHRRRPDLISAASRCATLRGAAAVIEKGLADVKSVCYDLASNDCFNDKQAMQWPWPTNGTRARVARPVNCSCNSLAPPWSASDRHRQRDASHTGGLRRRWLTGKISDRLSTYS